MSIHPPVLPPPPAGGKIKVTVRPPPATAVRSNSRQGPFIDLKGTAKAFLKTNTAVGQVKSLINQYKNIHNIKDVVGAVKSTYSLAKKIFGSNIRSKGSLVGRNPNYVFKQNHPLSKDETPKPRTNSSELSTDKLVAKINATGLAKSHKFKVIFTPPKAILDLFGGMENVSLMCDAAEFPGRSFNANDSRIYGATFKTPNLSIYNEVNFTILCDQNLSEKYIFDMWMEYINPKNAPESPLPGSGFDFEYRDNYIAPVKIIQYSDTGDQTYVCDLKEAYPTAVAPLTTDWSSDQFHKVQITMCYRYWTEGTPEPANAADANGGLPAGMMPSFSNPLNSVVASAKNKVSSGALGGLANKAAGGIADVQKKLAVPSAVTNGINRAKSITSKIPGGFGF